MQVKDIMTGAPEESVEDCCKTMEGHQVRQVPVVDELGSCCGMVAQADVARRARPRTPPKLSSKSRDRPPHHHDPDVAEAEVRGP